MDEKLGIAGAGAIACGLATVAAPLGEVVMWVRSEASADRARRAVEHGCLKAGADVDPAHVRVVTDRHALAGATFVVEAVVENHEAKAGVLAELDAALGQDAVLATTTSSLSIARLAQASGRPDRFVGLHVFNPVPRMDLVELAFPPQATGEVRARARALCEALGKTSVEVPDRAGFVVNRLLFPYLFGAVDLLEQTGLEPAAIDACMTLGAGHPMGPLALLDLVGLDVAEAIGDSMGVGVPERVRAMVRAGETGRKAGAGFYAY